MPLDLLEPGASKGARRVLRGPRPSNEPGLPERGLRRPVVIRKNCYGSGATWSAAFAADAWSILATAAQNHLNPLAYLKAYLGVCAKEGGKAPEGTALERFMPWALGEADRVIWADTS